MATVIDSLTVELGLDPRKFEAGRRDATESFKKTKESAEAFGKDIEAQGMKLSEVFGVVKKGAMGIVGAFVGGEAAAFIDHIIGMDAATGRMAKTIGTSVENLGIWKSMIRQVGGSAEEATSAAVGLQTALNNVMQNNGMFSNEFGFLLTKIGGAQGKDWEQITRQLQSYFAEEIKSGRMTPSLAATQMSWVPGMNQSMINLLLDDFKKIETAARAIGGASDESAKGAQRLQAAFSLLLQTIERISAAVIPFLNLFTTPLKDIDKLPNVLPKEGGGITFDKGGMMDKLDTWLWGEYGQHGGAAPAAPAAGGRSSAADREAWIRSMAGNLGIDADTAMRVSQAEGFASFPSSIPGEQSFGDFQLNMNPGSMGDEFFKKTGLDPRDPRNEKAMDLFALQRAAAVGWDPNGKGFHGATNSGISNWQGIGARSSAASRNSVNNNQRSSSSTSSSEVHIGQLVLPGVKDADGFARDLEPAMKRYATISPAISGLA
jgi:hypothetical protein